LPQVWVEKPDDADRARSLIHEYLRPGPTGPPIRCPSCGEENPASFEICWSCGKGLEQ